MILATLSIIRISPMSRTRRLLQVFSGQPYCTTATAWMCFWWISMMSACAAPGLVWFQLNHHHILDSLMSAVVTLGLDIHPRTLPFLCCILNAVLRTHTHAASIYVLVSKHSKVKVSPRNDLIELYKLVTLRPGPKVQRYSLESNIYNVILDICFRLWYFH